MMTEIVTHIVQVGQVKTCLRPHSPPQINQAPCKNLGDITLTRCRVHKKWTFLICRTAELLSGLAINQLRTNYCILACTAQSACNVMLRVREPSGLSIPSFTWNIGRSGFNSQAHVFWVSEGYHWVYSFYSFEWRFRFTRLYWGRPGHLKKCGGWHRKVKLKFVFQIGKL